MKYVDEFFKERTKDISFIEIKEDSHVLINDRKIETGISLPIITKDLVEKIHTMDIDEIEIKYIIEGIIYILGADPSFIYNEEYKRILNNYDNNIEEYILYRAIKLNEEDDYIGSGIFSRALLSLEGENIKGLFNYSLVLEKIGIEYIEKDDIEKSDKFISYASDVLNQILKIDDKFELAYYKLGFHYKHFQNFLKANLIWKKFIQISKDANLSQEVREELLIVEDDSNLEVGITYLNYMDFDKALDAFLKLMPKHEDNWNLNYLIGQTYNGLNKLDLALEYMKNALDLNKEDIDIYNSLGGIYINIGNINKAIEIFTMGIEKFEEDYSLYFNRGISFIGIGDIERAFKDIKEANALNPDDDVVKSTLEDLRMNINSGQKDE